MMPDHTKPQLERLARAVWPDERIEFITWAEKMFIEVGFLGALEPLHWDFIGPVLLWLAKEVGEDPDELFDDSDVFSMLTADDPKASILRAAIEWQERNNQ